MPEGAIRSQVNDGPVTVYKAGESFSELSGDRHGVSANASEKKPAPRGVGHFKALRINQPGSVGFRADRLPEVFAEIV